MLPLNKTYSTSVLYQTCCYFILMSTDVQLTSESSSEDLTWSSPPPWWHPSSSAESTSGSNRGTRLYCPGNSYLWGRNSSVPSRLLKFEPWIHLSRNFCGRRFRAITQCRNNTVIYTRGPVENRNARKADRVMSFFLFEWALSSKVIDKHHMAKLR